MRVGVLNYTPGNPNASCSKICVGILYDFKGSQPYYFLVMGLQVGGLVQGSHKRS